MTRREGGSWRELGRRAARIARQRDLGDKALLLGLGALLGALFAARGGAPPRAGRAPTRLGSPARSRPRPAQAVVRIAVAEVFFHLVGPVRGFDHRRVIASEERGGLYPAGRSRKARAEGDPGWGTWGTRLLRIPNRE